LWRQERNGHPGWDGESDVWRVEFRFKRDFLHTLKPPIEGAYDLLDQFKPLWDYAAGRLTGGEDGLPDGWLRYVIPTEDTNRSRWPVHPDWQAIQSAFAPVVLPESDYEREEREKEELLQLVDAELEAHPWKDPSRMVKCNTSSS